MGARLKNEPLENQPGPGAYNPMTSNPIMKRPPMFSFGSRPSESAAFKVPGPGSYDQKSSVVGVPSSKFGLA